MMSIGYCGRAILEMADATTLLYLYCSYNLNLEDYQKHEERYNGEIIINRNSLIEPEVCKKRIRKPSGRKIFEERLKKREVDVRGLIESGDVQIINSSGAWHFNNEYDVMAIRLIEQIYDKYQEERDIPEMVNIFQ